MFLLSESVSTWTRQHRKILPFSLFWPVSVGTVCEDSGNGGGLEDAGGRLLEMGVPSALDLGTGSKAGTLAFGVALDGAGPGVLLKKPAMLCCLPVDFCVEPPVFLGAVRGVAISFPSIPRAMVVDSVVRVECIR